MILSCPACATRYRVNDSSPEAAGPTHTCRYCDHVWQNGPAGLEPPAKIAEALAPAAASAEGDVPMATTEFASRDEAPSSSEAIPPDRSAWNDAPSRPSAIDTPTDISESMAPLATSGSPVVEDMIAGRPPYESDAAVFDDDVTAATSEMVEQSAVSEERDATPEATPIGVLPEHAEAAAFDHPPQPTGPLAEEPAATTDHPLAMASATPTVDPRDIWRTEASPHAAWPADPEFDPPVAGPVRTNEDPPYAPIATPTADPRDIWNTLESPYSAWPADPETSPEPAMPSMIAVADPMVEPPESADGGIGVSPADGAKNIINDGCSSSYLDASSQAEPKAAPYEFEVAEPDHAESAGEPEWRESEEPDWLTALAQPAEPIWSIAETDPPSSDEPVVLEQPGSDGGAAPDDVPVHDEAALMPSDIVAEDGGSGECEPAGERSSAPDIVTHEEAALDAGAVSNEYEAASIELPTLDPLVPEPASPSDLPIQWSEAPETASSSDEPSTTTTEDEIGQVQETQVSAEVNESGAVSGLTKVESDDLRPDLRDDAVARPEDLSSAEEPQSSPSIDEDLLEVPTHWAAPIPQCPEVPDHGGAPESMEMALPDDLRGGEDSTPVRTDPQGATADSGSSEAPSPEQAFLTTDPSLAEAWDHGGAPEPSEIARADYWDAGVGSVVVLNDTVETLSPEPMLTSFETDPSLDEAPDQNSVSPPAEMAPPANLGSFEADVLVMSDLPDEDAEADKLSAMASAVTPELVASDIVMTETTPQDIEAAAHDVPSRPIEMSAAEPQSQPASPTPSMELVVTTTTGRALIPMSDFGPKQPVEAESGSRAQVWIALAAACLLILSGLGIFRDQIVAAWPLAGQAYAAINWPAPVGTGLQLSPAMVALSTDNGRAVFLLTGTITNKSSAALPLPKLHVSLLGDSEQEMRSFDMDAGKESLSPGELTTFSLSIEDPPVDASKARVIFVGS